MIGVRAFGRTREDCKNLLARLGYRTARRRLRLTAVRPARYGPARRSTHHFGRAHLPCLISLCKLRG